MKKQGKTEQFMLRLDMEIIRRLREEAERFGYDSGNQVALEIVDRYFEFWVATKEAEFAALQQQKESLLGKPLAELHSNQLPRRKIR